MRPTPESCLIGVIFLITLFVNSQSRVMLDRFWVDAGEPNVITKPLLIKDAIEAKKASIQPPQNRLLNPNKISAFEPYPKQKIGYISLENSSSNYKNERPRFAEPDTLCEAKDIPICDRCQRITRAPQAFSKCCLDIDNAFSWCQRIYKFSSKSG